MKTFIFLCLLIPCLRITAQTAEIDDCNVTWTSQSKNSGESMPCGGGDIGLNVWVENGEILIYLSRTGTFDDNNAFLKLGRIRVKLSPNPFAGNLFRQELLVKDGYIKIDGSAGNLSATLNVWVDVFQPVVHLEARSNKSISMEAGYESWRYKDRVNEGSANNANSFKWSKTGIVTYKDEVLFEGDEILFYHQNKNVNSAFDVTVKQQGLDSVKSQLFNPLDHLVFGGSMSGNRMKPAGTYSGRYINTDFMGWKLKSAAPSKSHGLQLYLHVDKAETVEQWRKGLREIVTKEKESRRTARQKTIAWWNDYWQRSYIFIEPGKEKLNSPQWQAGRNYQLMRYMLGCNAYGKSPTKFNGGLFTYDPVFTDSSMKFTPDHRNWGGGLMTAQNQRLVYFPLIRAGDFDMLKPQFDFYLNSLQNAELRSKVYWGHNGACFPEQVENFGLPNSSEYGWKRPATYDKGIEYNAWLEYEWDTVLEFCLMMLETQRYAAADITRYIPLIESCVTFFDEHYRYLARQRSARELDSKGQLVLYPGSAAETYKMAYNSTTTIAGLKTILSRLLALPPNYLNEGKRKHFDSLLSRIPPISFGQFNGHPTILPAAVWERVNNTEAPQLYPVFPWGLYGVGKSGLDTALNTYRYDTNVVKFKSPVGWKQYNIFAARLGLTDEAAELNIQKMKNSGRRFPAFWGPGYDWVPDHNWGGSGMIGLQEMLMQTDDRKILLFPAWPKTWDVHFKLHAPYNTTCEGVVANGKLVSLKVIPESRMKDVVNMF
jgi:hypothetical protein